MPVIILAASLLSNPGDACKKAIGEVPVNRYEIRGSVSLKSGHRLERWTVESKDGPGYHVSFDSLYDKKLRDLIKTLPDGTRVDGAYQTSGRNSESKVLEPVTDVEINDFVRYCKSLNVSAGFLGYAF